MLMTAISRMEFDMDRHKQVERVELTLEIASWPIDRGFIQDWERLYSRTPYSSVFCRLEWILTAIAVYGGQEEILPCRFHGRDGALLAMGIFMRRKEVGKRSSFTVIRTVDYNSQRIIPMVAPDMEAMADALACLRDAFGHEADYFDLFKLDGCGDGLGRFHRLLKARGIPHEVEVFNEQPRFMLEGSWDGYLDERTQGHRKKIRRYTRKLQEEYPDYRFTRLRSPGDFAGYGLDAAIGEVMDLYLKGWQAEALEDQGGGACADLMEFYKRIATRLAPLGLVEICMLKADGTLLAFELNVCEGGSIHMLFGSYDRRYAEWSPGNAILSELLQDSYRRGDRCVEFGGEYLEYKRLWTKDAVNSYHLRMYGRTLRAVLRRCLRQIRSLLKARAL